MADLQDLQNRINSLNQLLDPNKAPDSLTAKECSELGMLSLQVNAVSSDFNQSGRTKKDLDFAIKELDKIESKSKKILKKDGGFFGFVIFLVTAFVLYQVFV